jgi:hypothetical protein
MDQIIDIYIDNYIYKIELLFLLDISYLLIKDKEIL